MRSERSDGPPVERVRHATCPACWAAPGRPCSVTGPDADHLSRWMPAEKQGLISRGELAAIVGGLEVIAEHVYIRAEGAGLRSAPVDAETEVRLDEDKTRKARGTILARCLVGLAAVVAMVAFAPRWPWALAAVALFVAFALAGHPAGTCVVPAFQVLLVCVNCCNVD